MYEHLGTSSFLVSILLCHHLANTQFIIIRPNNTEALIGNLTYFNCSTDPLLWYSTVQWYFKPIDSDPICIYSRGELNPRFAGRFQVIGNNRTGTFDLVIASVTASDAGRYDCFYNSSSSASAELIVLGSFPYCQYKRIHEDTAENGALLEISCSVHYSGNIPPSLEWTTVRKKTAIACRDGPNRLPCVATIPAAALLDDSYVCRTRRSVTRQYNCTLDAIETSRDTHNGLNVSLSVLAVFLGLLLGLALIGWFIHYRKLELSYKRKLETDDIFVQLRTALKEVRGIAVLGEELFLTVEENFVVLVYDKTTFGFRRLFDLLDKGLCHSQDITSCARNTCLYIMDVKHTNKNREIFRINPDGELITKWQTGKDWGQLSVAGDGNIICTVCASNKLREYLPDGRVFREVVLSSLIANPCHAIKLADDQYVVVHGSVGDKVQMCCMVNKRGTIMKSFGGKVGSSKGRLSVPVYLAETRSGLILVVDQWNSRVVVLNSALEFQKLAVDATHGLRRPVKMCYDAATEQVFVAVNEGDKPYRKVLVYKVGEEKVEEQHLFQPEDEEQDA